MTPTLPRLSRVILTLLLPGHLRRETLDELAGRFAEIAARDGIPAARQWYRRQASRCLAESPARILDAARGVASELVGSGLGRDVRLAARGLARSPGFSAATIAVLAIGIGGTTAVSSVLAGIMLRPPPYASPEQLAVVWSFHERQQQLDGSSHLNTDDWFERSRTLEDLALYYRPAFTKVTIGGASPTRVQAGSVTANFFSVLGVSAAKGRLFGPADLQSDTRVAVVRAGFLDQLGRSADEDEPVIDVNGDRIRVVGVAPPALALPTPDTQVWLLHDPTQEDAMFQTRRNDAYVVLARVRPEFDVADAAIDLKDIAGQLAVEHPATNTDLGVSVSSLRDETLGDRVPAMLWMLFAAVVLVLLVAASNAGHLLVMRAARRQREHAVRTALGATRLRIIRQLALEGLLLGAASVVAGVAIGAVGLEWLLGVAPPDTPNLDQVTYDLRALGIGAAAAAIAAPVFAVLPALLATRHAPADALRSGGRSVSRPHARLVRGLVLVELTLAVVLLAETGLVVRSAQSVGRIDPGFDAEHVLMATVDLDSSVYDDRAKMQAFYDEALAKLSAIPGVRAAGAVDDFFLSRFPDQTITVDGVAASADAPPRLTTDVVTAGYFESLGLRIEEGQPLTSDPTAGFWPPRGVVINRAMANAFWPGESPVGRQFWFGDRTNSTPAVTVMGVVPDIRRERLEAQPFPTAYLLNVTSSMDLLIRTTGDPMAVVDQVRQVVREVDPRVPVSAVSTAGATFSGRMGSRYFQVWLLGSFSVLTVLLAAVGLFALLSEAVVSRRRELGVRLALGATPSVVGRLVVKEGLALTSAGLALGLAGAWAAGRATEGLLFGVTPGDPTTLVVVVCALLAVAGIASWLPAHRASQVPVAQILSSD